MKKSMNDLAKSFKELVRYNEKMVGANSKVNKAIKVNGWMNKHSNEHPFAGKGCLICFQYTNVGTNEVMYYAFSDKEVLDLFNELVMNIISDRESMNYSLYIKGITQIFRDYNCDGFNLDEWDVEFIVKPNYDESNIDSEDYDLSHLSTMDGFTIENLINDMNDIRMRDINLAQFVAEECMVLLSREQRAA